MKSIWTLVALASLSTGTVSCGSQGDKGSSQAQTVNQTQGQKIPVDVAIASLEALEEDNKYTGTTAPIREVAVKSRVEGRLIDLAVDIGDRVEAGQVIGQLDDAVLTATVLQAEAEVAALPTSFSPRSD